MTYISTQSFCVHYTEDGKLKEKYLWLNPDSTASEVKKCLRDGQRFVSMIPREKITFIVFESDEEIADYVASSADVTAFNKYVEYLLAGLGIDLPPEGTLLN